MWLASQSEAIQGAITVPGDKSLSHRAVLLASIADGQSTIRHFLPAEDCMHTVQAMRVLGVHIEQPQPEQLLIRGVGLHGLKPSKDLIDCGNAGTLIRLLSGILAGQPFETHVTGDQSLCQRPMARILQPLHEMGAKYAYQTPSKTPPFVIRGRYPLRSFSYDMPVASAQVKSCLLLAGLYTQEGIQVTEPQRTRDHTERLLATFGGKVQREGLTVTVKPHALKATDVTIPGDFSSAAFFIAAACLIPQSHLLIKGVGLNPTRIGLIEVLKRMGADIRITEYEGVEPYGDIEVKASQLKGIKVPDSLVASMIDEFPILFVVAAFAEGETIVNQVAELRVKESDRLTTMADNLRNCGVPVELKEDGLTIQGGYFQGGGVSSYQDHRVAMAFAVAGWACKKEVRIRDVDCVQTSFPQFYMLSQSLGLGLIKQQSFEESA